MRKHIVLAAATAAALFISGCASVDNYRLGSDALKAGDFDSVIMYTTVAVDTGRLPPSMQARAYRNRGDAYFGKQQYDIAIQDFSSALAIDPNVDDTLNRRGGLMAATPHIVGYQAAGIVREVGERATQFQPGDRVVATTPFGSHAIPPRGSKCAHCE